MLHGSGPARGLLGAMHPEYLRTHRRVATRTEPGRKVGAWVRDELDAAHHRIGGVEGLCFLQDCGVELEVGGDTVTLIRGTIDLP